MNDEINRNYSDDQKHIIKKIQIIPKAVIHLKRRSKFLIEAIIGSMDCLQI